MLISVPAAPSSSSLSLGGLGPYSCHRCYAESIICSTSYVFSNWIRAPFELRRFSRFLGLRSDKQFSGTMGFLWFPESHDTSQVSVAADYSDAVPESSSHVTSDGYHPLEELGDHGHGREEMPTSAEIARTVVEANNKGLLLFPNTVHCEPHEHISWGHFQYVIDDFGDMFFEVLDGQNIMKDHEAINPVSLGNIKDAERTELGEVPLKVLSIDKYISLIGMHSSHYERKKMDIYDDCNFVNYAGDDTYFPDDYFEIEDSGKTDFSIDWGMPEIPTPVHPVYFAKCLREVIAVEHSKLMDHPSNGVAIYGFLQATYVDREYFFNNEDSNVYASDCRDGDTRSYSSSDDGSSGQSTIYRLKITKIELFSMYGVQSIIGVQDFQSAEPDVLVHSIPSIQDRLGDMGSRCNVALKALCKKKGLQVERACLVGVDSLGIDVRISSGTEVRTHRFPFKNRATSEFAADKQIHQLLFPRSRRKRLRTLDERPGGER